MLLTSPGGGGQAANDLIGGQIDYMCGNMGTAVARAAAKQSKPLALLSRERSPLMHRPITRVGKTHGLAAQPPQIDVDDSRTIAGRNWAGD
jgi:hypothetical protein